MRCTVCDGHEPFITWYQLRLEVVLLVQYLKMAVIDIPNDEKKDRQINASEEKESSTEKRKKEKGKKYEQEKEGKQSQANFIRLRTR